MVYYKHLFEFDPIKSALNRQKHGIDFERATELWEGNVLTIKSKNRAEDRLLVIGKLGEETWTAVITYREDRIRIISVRRARHEEKELYEANHR